jgi:NDP-sugar pyrophosphorylase family protein
MLKKMKIEPMKPSLLILAAGIGSRYGSLKQMDRFGPSGETLIDYSIFDAMRAGFRKVIFIISKIMENEFKEIFFKKYPDEIEVDYVLQRLEDVPEGVKIPPGREKPWGTTHAVLSAASKINEPFAVLNADDFYGANSFRIIFSHLSSLSKNEEEAYCIVGYRLSKTLSEHGPVARAICELDEKGYLKSIVERLKIKKIENKIFYQDEEGRLIEIKGDPMVSMNMMGFSASVFPHLKLCFEKFIQEHSQNPNAELYLPNVVNEMIKAKAAKVKILSSDEDWFGVTYKEDKAKAIKKIEELVKRGIYPRNLWKGR